MTDTTTTTSTAVHLGPATETRFAEAFFETALITKQAAAKLLGLDPGTLDALTLDGTIRAVPRGKLRAYTERDLRAFLTEPREPRWPSTDRRRAASPTMTSPTRPAAFTARRGAKPAAGRKP
jgi:hypothetical protein